MAKIGLKYPVFKSATTAAVIGEAIQADITIESNDVKLYADDAIAESDYSFKSGKITLGIDKLESAIVAGLLGHDVVSEEITAKSTDTSPEVGFGFYAAKVVDGVKSYRAIWLPAVRFTEPADSNKTKGESTEFGTHTIEGVIRADSTDTWKKEKTFTLEADAKAYLDTLAGLELSASAGLSALSMTGTGGTLTPSFGAAVRYYAFYGVTGTTVTVTPTAANHTIKLYIDGVYSQDIVSGAASASISISTGTKKLTLVCYEAGKSSQTTEIVVQK